MGETIKRLGAVTVGLNIDTSLYTCPADTMTAISCINVCNASSSGVTFRLAHIDGVLTAISAEDYIAYDEPLSANKNVAFRLGNSLSAGDTIMVRASANGVTVSFQAWGSEVT